MSQGKPVPLTSYLGCSYYARNQGYFIKFKVHLSDLPHVSIQNTTAKREQHAHSDEIVQQNNIMSTQVVSGAVTSGGTEIPESSSKLSCLRHDSIHTLLHQPGTETETKFSSHIGRGLPHKQKQSLQIYPCAPKSQKWFISQAQSSTSDGGVTILLPLLHPTVQLSLMSMGFRRYDWTNVTHAHQNHKT